MRCRPANWGRLGKKDARMTDNSERLAVWQAHRREVCDVLGIGGDDLGARITAGLRFQGSDPCGLVWRAAAMEALRLARAARERPQDDVASVALAKAESRLAVAEELFWRWNMVLANGAGSAAVDEMDHALKILGLSIELNK